MVPTAPRSVRPMPPVVVCPKVPELRVGRAGSWLPVCPPSGRWAAPALASWPGSTPSRQNPLARVFSWGERLCPRSGNFSPLDFWAAPVDPVAPESVIFWAGAVRPKVADLGAGRAGSRMPASAPPGGRAGPALVSGPGFGCSGTMRPEVTDPCAGRAGSRMPAFPSLGCRARLAPASRPRFGCSGAVRPQVPDPWAAPGIIDVSGGGPELPPGRAGVPLRVCPP